MSVLSYDKLDFASSVVIGRGQSGPVRVARRRDTGRSVAVKCLWDGKVDLVSDDRRRRKTRARNMVLEVHTMMRDTPHPNVLPIVGLASSPNSGATYLLTEYAARGSLADAIARSATLGMPADACALATMHIASALEHLHDTLFVAHGDVKPANILIMDDASTRGARRYLLADMGAVRELGARDRLDESSIGTPYYMSPERIDGERASPTSDIWALGCTAYVACTGAVPFAANSPEELCRNIRRGAVAAIPRGRTRRRMCATVNSALHLDPGERPTAAELYAICLADAGADDPVPAPRPPSPTPTPPVDRTTADRTVHSIQAHISPPPPPPPATPRRKGPGNHSSSGVPPPTLAELLASDMPPPLESRGQSMDNLARPTFVAAESPTRADTRQVRERTHADGLAELRAMYRASRKS
jgi:serine/threonine protein kinase